MEDSALVRDALRVLLESTGHRVSGAESLEQAREIAGDDRPDLVLLDLTLPDGDGLALIKQLDGAGGAAPVYLALTGRDEPSERARCLQAGCVEVLVKPVPTRALIESTRRWLKPIS